MSRHGSSGRSTSDLVTASIGELGVARKGISSEFEPAHRTVSDLASSTIVVIEGRSIIRDCLLRGLGQATGAATVGLMSTDELLEMRDLPAGAIAVLCVSGSPTCDQIRNEIEQLATGANPYLTIVVSDSDDINDIVPVLRFGAKGYIPTSMTLDVAVEAIRLVRAGGTFLPASCIMQAGQGRPELASGDLRPRMPRLFTARQAAVVDALRKGKANKIIAYELSMRESTVKVHVRNIMKKLNARNRTEVAYLTTQLIADGGVPTVKTEG